MNSKINELMSTEERIKILGDVLFKESIKVSETARRLKLSKGLVSKYFDILLKGDVLKKKGFVFLVKENYKVRGLKIMFNVLGLPQIFGKYKFVRGAGLYGSAAKGMNTIESDLDLWIKVDKTKEEELARLNSELSEKVKNVNVLILDEEKIKEIKKDEMFYYSLFFGSVILYGENNEI